MSAEALIAQPLPHPPPLTEKQREIIKSTVPLLAEHGTKITAHMYKCMLGDIPELNNIFSRSKQDTGHQAGALAASVYAYAAHIDDLTPIVPFVDRFCHKHASLNIQAGHYNVVGKYLLEAIGAIVGADVFKGELYEAWYSAYWALAHLCIEREAALYKQAGWTGWKEFTVAKRVQETDEIVSFYLTPKDGTVLRPYHPGQYVSVQKYVKELGIYQSRQYSLSDAPSSDHYRISVKRESDVRAVRTNGDGTHVDTRDSSHPGWISTLLHDTLREGDSVEIAHPFGEFYLDDTDAPVVLISAGVGVTPMLAMLNTLTAENVSSERRRQVSWVQAVRNSHAHAFKARVRELVAQHPEQVTSTVFYSAPDAEATLGNDFDVQGRMDLAKVEPSKLFFDKPSAQYYLCGPEEFMMDISNELKSRGVDGKRVHREMFGPGGWVL